MCTVSEIGLAGAGTRMVSEQDLNVYLSKFDKKYWLTYKVLDILQKVLFNFIASAPHSLIDWGSNFDVAPGCAVLQKTRAPTPCFVLSCWVNECKYVRVYLPVSH